MNLFAVLAVPLSACAAGEIVGVKEAGMLSEVRNYVETTKLTSEPFKSSLGDFLVNVYVNEGQNEYLRIRQSLSGSGARMPIGAMIVREVLDAQGGVSKLTVMAKETTGYDPTLGDWWFAVTDPSGEPLIEGGQQQVGRLTACHACHDARAADDFLLGMP